ncbi:Ig-like domain-containing protein [Salinisphaera sp. SPP-AMP-43]|uniref:Ig-like domain-containing protein n=1 Tax=Salinisphaera sp. SPP-AMP-43 TaxID=3121288 RepID=UPI003C6EA35C
MSTQGTNNGDGTWEATLNEMAPGTYPVTVIATDPNTGESVSDTATLIVRNTASQPVLAADDVTSAAASPTLTGQIDDPDAVVVVTIPINGTPRDYEATNNGDGTWVLEAGTYPDQDEGRHQLDVIATGAGGNDSATMVLTIGSATSNDGRLALAFDDVPSTSLGSSKSLSNTSGSKRSLLFFMRVDEISEGVAFPLAMGGTYGGTRVLIKSDGTWQFLFTGNANGTSTWAQIDASGQSGVTDGWAAFGIVSDSDNGTVTGYMAPLNGAAVEIFKLDEFRDSSGYMGSANLSINEPHYTRVSRYGDKSDSHFIGAITNVAYLTDQAVTASDVENLASGASTIRDIQPTPFSHWTLDGPDDLVDRGIAGNDLVLSGDLLDSTNGPSILPAGSNVSDLEDQYRFDNDSGSGSGANDSGSTGDGPADSDSGSGSTRVTAQGATITSSEPAPDLSGAIEPADNDVLITIKNDEGVTVHNAVNDGSGGWTLAGGTYGGFGSNAAGTFRISVATYDADGNGYYAHPSMFVEGTETPLKGSKNDIVLDHSRIYDTAAKLPSQLTSMASISNYEPSPDRVIGERSPIDTWPHFNPPASDPGDLPTMRVVFDDRDSGERWELDDVPIGLTPIKRPDGSDHENVVVCRYRDCVLLENCWHDSDGEYAGNYEVYVNGELVFSEDEIFLFRWYRTVPVRDGQPQLPWHPIDPTIVPAYDYSLEGSLDESFYEDAISGNTSVNSNGQIYYLDMNMQGLHWYIGPLPASDTQFIIQPNARTATGCRQTTDFSAAYEVHVRDRATGRPLKYTDRPEYDRDVDLVTSIDENPSNKFNQAHSPGWAYVAALATGSDFDREQAAFYANAALWRQAGYRNYDECRVMDSQPRTYGWCLRSLLLGALVAPDDMQDYFNTVMNNNRDRLLHLYGEDGVKWNPLHASLGGASTNHGDNDAITFWEDDYIHAAVDFIVEMGYTDWSPIRDFFCTQNVMRFSEMCYQFSSEYDLQVCNTSFGTISVDTYPDALKLDHHNYDGYIGGEVCGTFAHGKDCDVGDFGDYPGSPTGYAAQMQPSLAGAVNAELNGADEAWDVFMSQRSTYPNFTRQPQFAVVPVSRASYPSRDYSTTFDIDPSAFVDGQGNNDRYEWHYGEGGYDDINAKYHSDDPNN